MRLALAAGLLLALAGSAAAGGTLPYATISTLPCRDFPKTVGSWYYGPAVAAIEEHLSRLGERDYFGSTCNVGDYAIASCRRARGRTVGFAVDALVRLRRSGRELPRIPMCGA